MNDPAPLPARANLEHLRNEAKSRLKALRRENAGATLAAAQLDVARRYGFPSWRKLKFVCRCPTRRRGTPRECRSQR